MVHQDPTQLRFSGRVSRVMPNCCKPIEQTLALPSSLHRKLYYGMGSSLVPSTCSPHLFPFLLPTTHIYSQECVKMKCKLTSMRFCSHSETFYISFGDWYRGCSVSTYCHTTQSCVNFFCSISLPATSPVSGWTAEILFALSAQLIYTKRLIVAAKM